MVLDRQFLGEVAGDRLRHDERLSCIPALLANEIAELIEALLDRIEALVVLGELCLKLLQVSYIAV
ncbi:hypothetical protein [Bosea sp. CS1GBMeth4]|uniref:hypothetical protein n=1 Tax=Bosea sp. CS1GBMeth4 TaxID=1892849 RepID=UPI001644A5E6|nr:hypothetical protein [Bosea sp. CS1GBMeth4]